MAAYYGIPDADAQAYWNDAVAALAPPPTREVGPTAGLPSSTMLPQTGALMGASDAAPQWNIPAYGSTVGGSVVDRTLMTPPPPQPPAPQPPPPEMSVLYTDPSAGVQPILRAPVGEPLRTPRVGVPQDPAHLRLSPTVSARRRAARVPVARTPRVHATPPAGTPGIKPPKPVRSAAGVLPAAPGAGRTGAVR